MRLSGFWTNILLVTGIGLGGSSLPAQAPVTALAGPPFAPSEITAGGPATGPATVHALDRGDVDTWLDGYMAPALAASDIPGAVVVVVKDGHILSARGFGYADVAKRTRIDPERTLFRIGSVSKLFTWTAAMQLVEQGKLDLDRDVNAYLDFRIPPRDGKPVTLRQLMTHTAGFEDTGKGIIAYNPKFQLSLERYIKRWTPHRIFDAGTTPAYSNWGTTLTAYIVQRVAHEEFDSYLERHIFQPLGMANATFRQPLPTRLRGQMATGYAKPGVAKGFEFVGPAPAGAGSVSGTDMARFMIAHLQGGELNGARILAASTATTMHDSPLAPVDPLSLMPPLNRMELGFFDTNVNGRKVIGHLGDVQAFHTSLHLFLADGVGLYMSFNSAGKDGAVQALRTGLFQDFADRYLPNVAPPTGRVPASAAAEHARMMTGHWIASRREDSSFLASIYWLAGQVEVATGTDGELVIPSLLAAGGRPRQWVEVSPFVWNEVDGHERIAAKVIDGRVVRWSFNLVAPFEVFDRVPAAASAAWLLPALYVALGLLALTFLQMPIAAIARRTYRVAHPLSGTPRRAGRAVAIMAGLTAALLASWAWATITALGSPDLLAGGRDGVFMALQVASAILLFGMVGIAGWNMLMSWRSRRPLLRRFWSMLILLAALLVLYVALRFNLMAMTVNY